MRLFDRAEAAKAALGPTVLGLGTFDGVHQGHRAVLAAAAESARELAVPALVVTFHPHPQQVLRLEGAPLLLMTVEERTAALARLGLDAVLILAFDRALSLLPAERFLDEILGAGLGAMGVSVGADFRFGHGRGGSADFLASWATARGISARIIDPVHVDGELVSSTRIRRLVAAGEVEAARRLLGAPFPLSGVVVQGDARGGTMGFPTANVRPPEPRKLLPADGVYAVRAWVGDRRFDGMMNVGRRPTFTSGEDAPRRVEVHLLGFEGDLYGRELRVEVLVRLRPERRFASAQELAQELQRDAVRAREALAAVAAAEEPRPPGGLDKPLEGRRFRR